MELMMESCHGDGINMSMPKLKQNTTCHKKKHFPLLKLNDDFYTNTNLPPFNQNTSEMKDILLEA